MITKVRMIGLGINDQAQLVEISPDKIVCANKSIISIDGSTSNTGIGILRESDGALLYSLSCSRENGESPVRYKIQLKKLVEQIVKNNRNIENIYYEEPCIGYATAVSNLFMLRAFIEELKIENEPDLDYIHNVEINNMKWKSLFLAPAKCPQGTDLQKKAVRDKLQMYIPLLAGVTQDEIDAIAMGFVATTQLRNGTESALQSKKAVKAFKYEVRFIGAEEDDDMLQEFYDVYNGPQVLLQNGIKLSEIPSRARFDKHIYETMGQEDKILILKFPSNKQGNVILEHKIGHLAANFSYIYAIVWRKNRKL